MLTPFKYNTAWMLACVRETRAYHRAATRVRATQTELLRWFLYQNRHTWFGTRHRFAAIRGVDDYRQAVPLSTYEDYAPAVERIAAGERSVLSAGSIDLLEPTSGSTQGEKLIPYNRELRRSFQRAIRTWIGDLFRQRPAVRHGYAYWSISPLASAPRSTAGGIPIGFDDDAAYLGTFERFLLANTMAVPGEIALCSTVASAQYATLFFLLRCRELSLISVWSPTFLQRLLDVLKSHWDQLCFDLQRGQISGEFSRVLPEGLAQSFAPLSNRASHLRDVFDRPNLEEDWVKTIWPRLALVSCWADGPSTIYAESLRHSLPGIEVQPKGLLATEAFVSIPLVSHPGASLAVRSHFFEFQEVNELGTVTDERTLLADELEIGRWYRVVVSTAGGFYRYQMMDQVEVVGFNDQIPLVEFIGKGDSTSDLVGEKLNAAHVQLVLANEFSKHALAPHYAALVAQNGGTPYYVLEIADDLLGGNSAMQALLCRSVEKSLRSNPGYRYARHVGQLGELRLAVLTKAESETLHARREEAAVNSGIRYGNLKPMMLRAQV